MAWTQADLDTLSAAIASNVRRVTFADGRAVEYHSSAEMLRVRAEMKTELMAQSTRVKDFPRATRGRVVRW